MDDTIPPAIENPACMVDHCEARRTHAAAQKQSKWLRPTPGPSQQWGYRTGAISKRSPTCVPER